MTTQAEFRDCVIAWARVLFPSLKPAAVVWEIAGVPHADPVVLISEGAENLLQRREDFSENPDQTLARVARVLVEQIVTIRIESVNAFAAQDLARAALDAMTSQGAADVLASEGAAWVGPLSVAPIDYQADGRKVSTVSIDVAIRWWRRTPDAGTYYQIDTLKHTPTINAETLPEQTITRP